MKKKKNEYCLSAYILETTCKEMYQLTIFLIYRPFSLLRLPAKKAGKFKNHRVKVDTSFHKLSLVIWKQLYLFLIDCTNLKKLDYSGCIHKPPVVITARPTLATTNITYPTMVGTYIQELAAESSFA